MFYHPRKKEEKKVRGGRGGGMEGRKKVKKGKLTFRKAKEKTKGDWLVKVGRKKNG